VCSPAVGEPGQPAAAQRGYEYTAEFVEAGASRRATTSRSRVQGRLGAAVELDHPGRVRFRVNNRAVRLADLTTAEIQDGTVLGTRTCAHLAGNGQLAAGGSSSVPHHRPYQLTDVLGTLTEKVRDWTPGSWPAR